MHSNNNNDDDDDDEKAINTRAGLRVGCDRLSEDDNCPHEKELQQRIFDKLEKSVIVIGAAAAAKKYSLLRLLHFDHAVNG